MIHFLWILGTALLGAAIAIVGREVTGTLWSMAVTIPASAAMGYASANWYRRLHG